MTEDAPNVDVIIFLCFLFTVLITIVGSLVYLVIIFLKCVFSKDDKNDENDEESSESGLFDYDPAVRHPHLYYTRMDENDSEV